MKREEFQALLRERILIFDGGFGSELYRRNFFVNTSYDALSLTAPRTVEAIHQAYLDAGCDVLTTNTYNASAVKLSSFGLSDRMEAINAAAAALARKVASGGNGVLVAGSIGPFGKIPAASAEAALRDEVAVLLKGKVDFLIFESLETLSDLDVVVSGSDAYSAAWMPSFVFSADGTLGDGASLEDVLARLARAENPPAAFGFNCGGGPEATLDALTKLVKKIALPVVVQPGAGAPRRVDNRFMPMTTPEYFTTYAMRYATLGARALGGCCGIGPEHIADLARSLKPLLKTERAAVFDVEVRAAAPLDATPVARRSPFGEKLASGKWLKLVEMNPPRGFDLADTVAKAVKVREAGFDAVNLPDGPRASCRMSQIITGIEIQEKAGIETVVHCCSRDRNLISLQSMILGCMAKNLRNILFITGDPPKLGHYPFSSGVFDVDSIGMVKLQERLNRGIDIGGEALGDGVKTEIVIGVGADPNAIDPEREYRRLAEKIESGADFIVTQPVFDPETLKKFLKKIAHFGIPVIAGVWPFASYRNAVFMKNEVPGVVVPDWIMRAMEKCPDKESQRAEGIRIARFILDEIRADVRGVATSAPLGRVDTAIEVCRGY
ncbi:MAG: bifunctional homocysteine S-methyltransferase/methylenetetrahydrofolate reductase [Victivallaceae bacterium]|nr:bifunctional homocysteine S-methyltransferase/methylenetetrahydrofolate reductase [Victivallaceae bacterium]